MKKGNIILLLFSILLGMVIIMQLKSANMLTDGEISSKKAKYLKIELENLTQKKEKLLKEAEILEDVIEDYQKSEEEKDIVIKGIRNNIKKYKLISGETDVKGTGIAIQLKNVELNMETDMDIAPYYRDWLLMIINMLKASGAEAVCINDERIVSNTEIALVETELESKIQINQKNMLPPFEIKCIGDPDKLESILNLKYGLIWNLKRENILSIELEKKELVKIPKYSKQLAFKFAKPIQESENKEIIYKKEKEDIEPQETQEEGIEDVYMELLEETVLGEVYN